MSQPEELKAQYLAEGQIVTFKCVNCGATLEGAGTCRFCGTAYFPSREATRMTDGVWIRVKPNFPNMLLGGDIRDNEKEERIETNVIDNLKRFHVSSPDKKESEAFLVALCTAAGLEKGVSFNGHIEGSVMEFIEQQQYSRSENQYNFVRQLPIFMQEDGFWACVSTEMIKGKDPDTMMQVIGRFKALRTELEKAMGFLVRVDENSGSQGSTKNPERSEDVDKKESTSPVRALWQMLRNIKL